MDVTPLIRANAQVIQSYRGGTFKISNVSYDHPIVVTADQVVIWSPSEPLRASDFEPLKALGIEVVLLGTGDKLERLPNTLRQEIKNVYGFTVDAMDTGAACRTYNVLMAEGRLIAAALVK